MKPTAQRPPAILLMGPTASGKSALALALARWLPVEIVSVDSAQIYRGMDIGTAKPGAAERSAVAHHLIDIIDPSETYSAAQFRADALAAVRAIIGRGRVPLLVGGTMLYFKALREGLSELPQSDAALRAQIDEEAAALGWPALHARLAKLDPETAKRLKPGDSQRIQRALEVLRISGRPLSAMLAQRAAARPPFGMIAIAIAPGDRAALHRRIEERFTAMLQNGLVEELRVLRLHFDLRPELPSMRCVGYRQGWRFLEGELDADGLRDQGIFATRQLAKRQLTWLRATPAQTFDCLAHDLAGQVRRYLDAQLSRNAIA